jgi:hypothetical protein
VSARGWQRHVSARGGKAAGYSSSIAASTASSSSVR